MGWFFATKENGPCSSCIHVSWVEGRVYKCQISGPEKYDRVNGTTRENVLCSEARSSSGFCGHKGNYWETATEPTEYTGPQLTHDDEGTRGNW